MLMVAAGLLSVAVGGVLMAQRDEPRPRLGYSRARFDVEQDAERRLQRAISPQSLSDLHRPLARRPHLAGTPAAREVADHLERLLRQFGLEVERYDYRVWLSHPRRIAIDLVAP